MRNNVQVGHECGLQNDRNVRRVEELDRIAAVLTPVAGRLDREVHSETLKARAVNKIPRTQR